MEIKNCYSIRYVANQTGLKPHIIRTWERRYAAVNPRRTETNRRIYSAQDIMRLHLLKKAVRDGHTISHVASLKTGELSELSHHRELEDTELNTAEDRGSDQTDTNKLVREALDSVKKLDSVALEKTLEDASIRLPRPKVLKSVIQPLFDEIGRLWAKGELKVINEHMASIVVRSFLWDLLRSVAVNESARKIVVAAPVGQWHESGALVVALTASESGWRAMYFGPNLPAEEIAAAVVQTGSEALALSVCHHSDEIRLVAELNRIKRFVGRQVRMYVGGNEIIRLKNMIAPTGAICIADMEQFRRELESQRTAP